MRNGTVYTLVDHITLGYQFIVVQKDDIVLDGAGYTVTGDYSRGGISTGLHISERTNITIQNFKLTNCLDAISLSNSQQISIFNNTLIKNRFGIQVSGYVNSSVFRNNFIDNIFDVSQASGLVGITVVEWETFGVTILV